MAARIPMLYVQSDLRTGETLRAYRARTSTPKRSRRRLRTLTKRNRKA